MRDMYTVHLDKFALRLSCTELLDVRLEHELAHIQRVLQGAVVFVRQLRSLDYRFTNSRLCILGSANPTKRRFIEARDMETKCDRGARMQGAWR